MRPHVAANLDVEARRKGAQVGHDGLERALARARLAIWVVCLGVGAVERDLNALHLLPDEHLGDLGHKQGSVRHNVGVIFDAKRARLFDEAC